MNKLDQLDHKLSGYHRKKYIRSDEDEYQDAELKSLDLNLESLEIDRLERNFLGWLTIAGIFIIGAGVIKDLVDYGKWYSLTFLVIVIIILTVTFSDYIEERERLIDEGIMVPSRLNWLAAVTVISIVALILLATNYWIRN